MTRGTEFERAVADLLKAKRVPYVRVDSYRCFRCGQVQNSSAAGMPDYLMLEPLIALELKTGKGRLTKGQKEFKEHWEAAGQEYILLRDTVDQLVDRLEGE